MNEEIKYANIMNNTYHGVWLVVWCVLMTSNKEGYAESVATDKWFGIFLMVVNFGLIVYNAMKMKSFKVNK